MRLNRPRLESLLLAKQIRELVRRGERLDGRGFEDFREIRIMVNTFRKAEGSAYLELGDTAVAAGIKFDLDTPFLDRPNEGMLMTDGEILPLASLEAEPGPPTQFEVELSRVVDRSIRESGMIDLEELVIEPGKKVIKVNVDFIVLSDAGNLFDASAMAAVAALSTSMCPDPKALKEDPELSVYDAPKVPLNIKDLPIAITVADLFGHLIVDPTVEEELVMGDYITITHTEKDEICASQKGGSKGLTLQQVYDALDISLKKSKEIRKILKEAVEEGRDA